jgi:hypothetical protein
LFFPKKGNGGYKTTNDNKLPQSMRDIKSLLDMIQVKEKKQK